MKWKVCALILGLFLIMQSGVVSAQTEPRPVGQETIEVRLLIIPFFAVDEEGKPVTDLKPEEVEVYIDGKPVKFEYFDRYIFTRTRRTSETVQTPEAEEKKPTVTPQPQPTPETSIETSPRTAQMTIQTPRQIFLIFDVAFSTRRGLFRSRDLAMDLVDTLRETDRVYILAYSALKGLRNVVGPISGREKVREYVRKIFDPKQAIEKVHLDQDIVIDDISSRLGFSSLEEFREVLEENESFNRWRYQTAAVRLADAFQGLGMLLSEVPGPKIIYYFSQGIRSDLYFSGDPGPSINSAGLGMTSNRFSRISQIFETPLQTLADSGAITLFINTEGGLSEGQDTLRSMASETGGLYVGGTDLKKVREHLENWTSAYYEVSYRQKMGNYEGRRHKVEVRIKRPGVKVLTMKGIREPKRYRYFSENEKELYALELSYRGDLQARYRPVDATFSKLPENPQVRFEKNRRIASVLVRHPAMRFERTYDVFSVLIESPAPGQLGQILSVENQTYRLSDGNLILKQTFDVNKGYVWAVVVIDRETGQTLWRRWYFPPVQQSEKSQQK